MKIDLTAPIYTDENKAREHLENIRWPDGPYCPHCGEADHARITLMHGKSHRPGLYKCKTCRKPFTVTVGTLFERSKVPLHKWVLATHLLCSSKKGMSSHQLHRMLGVTYKTAWFMAHRIRESMRDSHPGPMGGPGKAVEADETYWGGGDYVFVTGKGWQKKRGPEKSWKILTLVERGGRARSFHVEKVNASTLHPYIVQNVRRDSTLMTDEARWYKKVGKEFASHEAVNHSISEYVRGNAGTQVVENYYSILKRGLRGVYQHVGEQHLKRYICEFDFRYNTRARLGVSDAERAEKALQGISGKRLTYRRTSERRVA
jgi:transposase-like protein